MNATELRKRAELARAKGPMRAVAIWPDEADKLAGMLPVWRKPKEALPDSDIEVIVATTEGEVFPAYWDDETGEWRDLTAMPLPEHHVTHWCLYPEPPETTPCL